MYKIKHLITTCFLLFSFDNVFSQSIADTEIKRNISAINSPLKNVLLLEPRIFEYDTDKFKSLRLKEGKQYGFLAENVSEVFPALVTSKTINYMFGKNSYRNQTVYSVDAVGLIPVMVASIQELHTEIENLKKEIAGLKNRLRINTNK
ncbi:MAG: tail fiber domain-containing protein [Ferruginibacter sp.]